MFSGSGWKLRSFVPIIAVPPGGIDLKNNATDQLVPTSNPWSGRARVFQQADKLRVSNLSWGGELSYSPTAEKSQNLSDQEWKYIEPHLPAPSGHGRPRIHTLREILNATSFYV